MNPAADLWDEHDALRGKPASLERALRSLRIASRTLARFTDSLDEAVEFLGLA